MFERQKGQLIMKKLLTLLIVVIMTFALAACGGGEGDSSSSGASNRDATYELSDGALTCVIEYDSSISDEVQQESAAYAYVYSEVGSAMMHLFHGSTSADAYIESFKDAKLAGNYSDYYVKDLVVEPLHTYEANGYTYNTYTYSYKDVYASLGQEYENSGMLGYVQLTEDAAILIEGELYYDDWETFVESVFYVKEVK